MALDGINIPGKKEDDGFFSKALGLGAVFATVAGAIGTIAATGGIAAPAEAPQVLDAVGVGTGQAAAAAGGSAAAATAAPTAVGSSAAPVGGATAAGSGLKTRDIAKLAGDGVTIGREVKSLTDSPEGRTPVAGSALSRRYENLQSPNSSALTQPSAVLTDSLHALNSPEISDDARAEYGPIIRRALKASGARS